MTNPLKHTLKMINKIFLAISLVSLLLYLYGILTSIINVEENSCKMTYMFEYPQFVVSNKNLYLFLSEIKLDLFVFLIGVCH